MSNITLHPESVNFLVDMRDEWERPGTICTSVTVFGIHIMSKLHVCVDCIIFPLGSVIFDKDDVNCFDYGSSLYQKIFGSSWIWDSILYLLFHFFGKKLRLVAGRFPRWFVCTILCCAGILSTCIVRVWRGISFSYEHPLSLFLSTGVNVLLYVLTVEHFFLVYPVSLLSSYSCSTGKNFLCSSYLWVGVQTAIYINCCINIAH